MTDTPQSSSGTPVDHAWVHERIAAALAGGLSAEEQALFDSHINGCAECFDGFTEARDADRLMQRALSGLSPSARFEEQLLETLREKMMHKRFRPVVKRAGMAIAAAVALAATGVFAQYVVRTDGVTGPLSERMVADARSQGITLPEVWGDLGKAREIANRDRAQSAVMEQNFAPNVRGHIESKIVYSTEDASDYPTDEAGQDRMVKGLSNDQKHRKVNGNLLWNSEIHETDGQNIGFGDGHSDFDKRTGTPVIISAIDDAGLDRLKQLEVNGKLKTINLAGANSYAGKTTVSGGYLAVSGKGGVQFPPADASSPDWVYYGDGTQQQNFVSNFNQTVNGMGGDGPVDYYKPAANLAQQTRDGRTVSLAGVASDEFGLEKSKAPVPTNGALAVADENGKWTRKIGAGTSAPFDVVMVPTANVATGARDGDSSTHTGEGVAATQGSVPAVPAVNVPEIAVRKIIRNGQVEFEVRSFDDASATISAVVTEEGGFVSSTSSEKLANGKIRGTVVVRVPPERLDRTLLKLRALGDLKTQQISADDVTKQYTDIDSELRALRAMESRLIDLIKNGKGEVKDLVIAEKQLGEYRVRIEKLEGDLRYYNNLVGMATLSIVAYEKDIQTPTAASEQENITLAMETEDVEAKYKDARKILDDAKGRIVESELKKYDADQYSASIVVDVPADKADFVTAQLKQIGRVGNYTRDRKQVTTGGSGVPTVQVEQKDARITLTLYNLANIAPREITVLTVAVRDVDATYHKVLDMVRSPVPVKADENGKLGLVPLKARGRIVTSGMNGQLPQQMTAEIRADVVADEAQTVLQAILDSGEVIISTSAENADTADTTSAKRGIQLRLVNVASVPARERQNLRCVAGDVADAYKKLTAALQSPAIAANVRIVTSQLTETDPRTVSARLSFEARREALPAVDKAFADAGIDFLSRNVVRSNDEASTLDSKVFFQIDELIAADSLAPRRTTVLGVEVDNVEKALDALRASLSPAAVKEIEYNLTKEANGRVTGHLVIETPVGNAMNVLIHIKDIGGTEKVNQVVKNNQVPDAPFARERIDLTLSSPVALVESGKGVGATIRAALGSSATALLLSLYYVLTGILFLGPFLLVIWAVYRISRRRRVKAT